MRRIAALFAFVGLLLLAAVAGPPVAADVYVGASYISSDSEFDVALDNFDPDDSGYKLFGGYEIVRFLAIEASYRDLGSFQAASMSNAVDADIEMWDASARGILPLPGPFAVFARAGYANISIDGSVSVASVTSEFDEDDWELFYGVGVDIEFGRHVGLRVEWEQYDVDDELNSLSGGVFIRF